MVKKIIIISFVFMYASICHTMKAQIADSMKCDEYFRDLENMQPLFDLWAHPPILKKSNTSVLCELCNMVLNDSCKRVSSTLILDIKGVPICIKIYTKTINDSLKNEITKLLYQLKFEPAIGDQSPVKSHFELIINDIKCGICKHDNANKKKKISRSP